MKIKKIKIRKILLLYLFLPFILFASCTSTSLPVLGQNKIILKNIHIEYLNLGDSYFSIEKYQDAIRCYKIAWEDKDLFSICQYKIAQCYVHSSDWGNALSFYEELLLLDPENSSLKASIAYIYSMSGDINGALGIYSELLQQQPKDEKFNENYLAVLLVDKDTFVENRDKFENCFTNFKKDFPENSNITLLQDKYDSYLKELDKDNKKETEDKSDSDKNEELTKSKDSSTDVKTKDNQKK